MTDIDELVRRTAAHLAGRDVTIKWQNPPSESAAGQVVKTVDGDLLVYVGELTTWRSRLKVLLHEIAHCRLDADWIPVSDDHKRRPASIKKSPEARQRWRNDPRELRAQDLADTWLRFAERHAHEFFSGYQSDLECQLRSLLSWEG